MEYKIITTYCQKDLQGFYKAFVAGNKKYRVSKMICKIISTVSAIIFWCFAALLLIGICLPENTECLYMLIPSTIVIMLIGFIILFSGKRGFHSKDFWKAYESKGEELTFHFSIEDFTVIGRYSETKIQYAGIHRLYEDDLRFYLFISPRVAYIVPKQDFGTGLAVFRENIEIAANLKVEHK